MSSDLSLYTTCTTTGIVVGLPDRWVRPASIRRDVNSSRLASLRPKAGSLSRSLECTIIVPQERRTGGAGFLYFFFFFAVIDLIAFLARLAHGDDELTHNQD